LEQQVDVILKDIKLTLISNLSRTPLHAFQSRLHLGILYSQYEPHKDITKITRTHSPNTLHDQARHSKAKKRRRHLEALEKGGAALQDDPVPAPGARRISAPLAPSSPPHRSCASSPPSRNPRRPSLGRSITGRPRPTGGGGGVVEGPHSPPPTIIGVFEILLRYQIRI